MFSNSSNGSEKVYLINYIDNLVESYTKTQPIDEKIKLFIQIINRYLYQKHFQYDASTLKISLMNDANSKVMKLDSMSSGEKQIVSILSKILLSQSKEMIVLFDEPELSISMRWQETLLLDLMKSTELGFLMAVTHSPFIFENEKLFKSTYEISKCMKKYEGADDE